MGRFLKFAFPAAALAALISTPASAAALLFDLSGDYSASWVLDSNPVPNVALPGSFTLWDVPGNFPGATQGVVDLQFWTGANGGGLTIDDFLGSGGTLADLSDAQVFMGSPYAPLFVPGTFELTHYGVGNYTLYISALVVPSGGPEPGTWALMIGGFGLVGASLRRRKLQPA